MKSKLSIATTAMVQRRAVNRLPQAVKFWALDEARSNQLTRTKIDT